MEQKIDRSKIYYKITNESENHYGLQYHDGLVEDILPFNSDPTKSCVEGGIYFTDLEHLPEFFSYGKWIRPIKLPADAQVILDPENNKYRSDKVFMLPREDFNWYFDTKFNKNTFNWKAYSGYLTNNCSIYFDKWWDKYKFNWEYYSGYLAEYCPNHFDKWWNNEKFNWADSDYLAIYCATHFKKWWDSTKFNWTYSTLLIDYCLDYFNIWWNKDKFNWTDASGHLITSCSIYFDKWWDKNKFNWFEYSDLLVLYYSNHFEKWWDSKKFNWKYSSYLKAYCSKYENIWNKK